MAVAGFSEILKEQRGMLAQAATSLGESIGEGLFDSTGGAMGFQSQGTKIKGIQQEMLQSIQGGDNEMDALKKAIIGFNAIGATDEADQASELFGSLDIASRGAVAQQLAADKFSFQKEKEETRKGEFLTTEERLAKAAEAKAKEDTPLLSELVSDIDIIIDTLKIGEGTNLFGFDADISQTEKNTAATFLQKVLTAGVDRATAEDIIIKSFVKDDGKIDPDLRFDITKAGELLRNALGITTDTTTEDTIGAAVEQAQTVTQDNKTTGAGKRVLGKPNF